MIIIIMFLAVNTNLLQYCDVYSAAITVGSYNSRLVAATDNEIRVPFTVLAAG